MAIRYADFTSSPRGPFGITMDGRLVCRVRRKPVPATPEEVVRQKVLAFLEEALQLPPDPAGGASRHLSAEESLAHFGAKEGRQLERVDIVIWDGDVRIQASKPIMLVECKMGTGILPDTAWEQVARYNRFCNAPYVGIANASQFLYRGRHGSAGSDSASHEMGLVLAANYNSPVDWDHKPLAYAELTDTPAARSYSAGSPHSRGEGKLRRATRDDVADSIGEMLEDLLLDTSVENSIPETDSDFYDLGIRWVEPTNPMGTWPGNYRALLLKDQAWPGIRSVKQVSIAVMHDGRDDLPRLVLNADFVQAKGSIGNKNSLQLPLDEFTILHNSSVVIWHSGRMQGARRPAEQVLDFVAEHDMGNGMVVDGHPFGVPRDRIVILGILPDAPLYLTDSSVRSFVGNCCAYAALRREFLLRT